MTARSAAQPLRSFTASRVPVSFGLSGRHRGPDHDHVNLAAYYLSNSHENENPCDHAAPGARVPRPSPRTALSGGLLSSGRGRSPFERIT
jgi:hypothetical protein